MSLFSVILAEVMEEQEIKNLASYNVYFLPEEGRGGILRSSVDNRRESFNLLTWSGSGNGQNDVETDNRELA